ncbi:hypothetical protein PR202_gb13781 [Eleusine coracana subsp. coracana]|uniref:Acyl-coenzyme A thioesterase 13 n=1 Tax=Eleusine coracana subsp. coracana TaxID=191504 RepID=A0AAV5ETB2_ELECO|nr:hypothetical protein QOZ80_9BG0719170 [Eleusine coracana subsp. coracana]GJN25895.1 hypothetical protein PR202_gb13781 [Eleusine coracana subsp. coracana]
MAESKTTAAAAELLRVSDEDGARVDALDRSASAMKREGEVVPSFFEGFALQGIRVNAIHPGRILCSFTVPARLTSSTNRQQLAAGAVVALVDEIGSAVSVSDGKQLKVSVDMSVALVDLAAAAAGDTLRITARTLGHKGFYSGTHVLIVNAATGQVVAEGRHSLFGKLKPAPPPTIIKSNI